MLEQHPFFDDTMRELRHCQKYDKPTDNLFQRIKDTLSNARKKHDISVEHAALQALGSYYHSKSKTQQAQTVYHELLQLSRQRNDKYVLMRAHFSLVYVVHHPEERIHHLEQSLMYAATWRDRSYVLYELGNHHLKIELSENAFHHYEKAMALLEACTPEEKETEYYIERLIDLQFGYIQFYTFKKNSEQVLSTCNTIQQLLIKKSDLLTDFLIDTVSIKLHLTRGTAFGMQDNTTDAIKEFEYILNELSPQNSVINRTRIHYNLATMYVETLNFEKAQYHIDKFSPHQQEPEHAWLQYHLPTLYATIAEKQQQYQEAIIYYQEAETIARSQNVRNSYFFSELYREWAATYEKAGILDKALAMHKQYYEVQEEVQNKRLQQSIAIGEAQLKIQTHKLEAVHAEREQQRLLEDNERQTSELLDYAKQFVWLQDVLQEFEQEFKNELTSQTIEIETLKTLLRSFQVLRRKVQLHDSDEIIRRAPQHFLPALHEQAKSELTELEQHVAVLIRAGLTGKQMPSLIHRSDGYLRHVRTKLKEKLPLPPNTTLKKYLQSL